MSHIRVLYHYVAQKYSTCHVACQHFSATQWNAQCSPIKYNVQYYRVYFSARALVWVFVVFIACIAHTTILQHEHIYNYKIITLPEHKVEH